MSCAHPFEQAHRRAALRIITEDEYPCEVLAHRGPRTLERTQQTRPRAQESLRCVLPAPCASTLDDARRMHIRTPERRGSLLAFPLQRQPLRKVGAHAVTLDFHVEHDG